MNRVWLIIKYFPYICVNKRLIEGNGVVPFFFSLIDRDCRKEINMEEWIGQIGQMVNNLIQNDDGLFLVEIKIKPTNNIKVFIDGDQGVNIDKLVHYNRKLYKEIEENIFPGGDFSLEVSSPGLDEPLKLHRQYLKNIGRNVEVIEKEGNKKEGKLIGVSDDSITVEEERGQGKKREIVQHTISFNNIKTTRIQARW